MTNPRSVAVENLARLPPTALAAFAARCARLAQQAWARVTPGPGAEAADALDAAIRLAEAAGFEPPAAIALDAARAALARLPGAPGAAGDTAPKPGTVPAGDRLGAALVHAAEAALDAAGALAGGAPDRAPAAAWWAYLHAYAVATGARAPDLAAGMAEALHRLQDAARRGDLTPATAVGPAFFAEGPRAVGRDAGGGAGRPPDLVKLPGPAAGGEGTGHAGV